MSLAVSELPKRVTASSAVDVNGECRISLRVQGRHAWQVEQVTTQMLTAPTGAECNLFVNDDLISPLLARRSVAAGEPPIPLFVGDTLAVVWTGCTPGEQGRALIIYRTATYQ